MSDQDLLIALTLAMVANGGREPVQQALIVMKELKKELDKL